ncbi:MAG TPA: hypothetical protein VGI59_03630 [Candidatus Udaeobacter sp.]
MSDYSTFLLVERVVLNALAEDASGSRLIFIFFFGGMAIVPLRLNAPPFKNPYIPWLQLGSENSCLLVSIRG